MIFQTQSSSLPFLVFGEDQPAVKPVADAKAASLRAMLISLCTEDWNGFFASKKELTFFPTLQICAEAALLLEKNSRSFKLLTMVSHARFFCDWECEEPKTQIDLFGALAVHSINKSTKETSFHRVAKAIRKEVLTQQNSCKPTKLRLRDCHQFIAQFMHEYAMVSEVNRAIVLTALTETELSGCGHLPSQQANSLKRKLQSGRCFTFKAKIM